MTEKRKSEPLLSLCMIVRDEEKRLGKCLESVLQAVDQIVIVDTGSRDNTVAIGKSFGAEVYEFEWCDDFSAARNYGLAYANSRWILFLDADEVMDKGSAGALGEVLNKAEDAGKRAIGVDLINCDREGRAYDKAEMVRIWRNGLGIKFKNRIHEIPDVGEMDLKTDVCIYHYGYHGVDPEERKRKLRRNLHLLEEARRREPDNWNHAWQIARDYLILGEWNRSLQCAEEAIELHCSLHPKTVPPSLPCEVKLHALEELGREKEYWEWLELLKQWYPHHLFHYLDEARRYSDANKWAEVVVAVENYLMNLKLYQDKKTLANEPYVAGANQRLEAVLILATACLNLGKADASVESILELYHCGAHQEALNLLQKGAAILGPERFGKILTGMTALEKNVLLKNFLLNLSAQLSENEIDLLKQIIALLKSW